MVTRIRRAVVAVALTLLLMATALAGVAWAANTIHCPGVTSTDGDGYCEGTDRNDVMYGTEGKRRDVCVAGSGHHVRARRGDALYGKEGPTSPTVAPETTTWGATATSTPIAARTRSTAVSGTTHRREPAIREALRGRGNDSIVDADSGRYPDVIRCGPGRDEVLYNKGFDKVAEDCEILKPYPKRWWTP